MIQKNHQTNVQKLIVSEAMSTEPIEHTRDLCRISPHSRTTMSGKSTYGPTLWRCKSITRQDYNLHL